MNSLLQFLTRSFAPILQNQLFPVLREELGAMSERHEQFVRALGMLQLDGFVAARHGRGRRPPDHASTAGRWTSSSRATATLHMSKLSCGASPRRCGRGWLES